MMYVSNIRSYIEAMGGRLDIVARFPQSSVAITNFSEVGEDRIGAWWTPESAKP